MMDTRSLEGSMTTGRHEEHITATLGTWRAGTRQPMGPQVKYHNSCPAMSSKEELGVTSVHKSFFHLRFLEPPVGQIKWKIQVKEQAMVSVFSLQDTEHGRWGQQRPADCGEMSDIPQ